MIFVSGEIVLLDEYEFRPLRSFDRVLGSRSEEYKITNTLRKNITFQIAQLTLFGFQKALNPLYGPSARVEVHDDPIRKIGKPDQII